MSQGSPEILIVHDDLHTAAHLADQLSDLGYAAVSTATDGLRALRMVCADRPDVVLAGTSLAGVDGHRFCRTLRLPLCKGSDCIPVILISSVPIDPLARELAQEVRAFALLPYPCDSETLHSIVKCALHRGDAPISEHRAMCCDNQALILSAESGDAMAAEMRGHGWNVVAAFGPDRAKETLQGADFDLVLLDDAMHETPHLLEWIKTGYPRITALVLTDSSDPEYLVRLTTQGADDILAKPVDLATLHVMCTGILNRESFIRLQRRLQERVQELQAVNDYFDMVIRHSQEAIFSCDLVG